MQGARGSVRDGGSLLCDAVGWKVWLSALSDVDDRAFDALAEG